MKKKIKYINQALFQTTIKDLLREKKSNAPIRSQESPPSFLGVHLGENAVLGKLES